MIKGYYNDILQTIEDFSFLRNIVIPVLMVIWVCMLIRIAQDCIIFIIYYVQDEDDEDVGQGDGPTLDTIEELTHPRIDPRVTVSEPLMKHRHKKRSRTKKNNGGSEPDFRHKKTARVQKAFSAVTFRDRTNSLSDFATRGSVVEHNRQTADDMIMNDDI
ncbi:hypothetical protein HELRODRAFT_169909 [Helobdella robusta]|uniref:Uncharacterized protein n=1 Tax=Helobdella robusta TaxID=6412 RepID=T1F2F7_HELRO|nr:hypothetical protein HELRODRAFT_169909 [Helobdella robusta]ESO08170.1 hypothetical protein HELRODRAFT_169909 [Helobdella robusta]